VRAALLALALVAPSAGRPVVVGSKNFVESEVLAELLALSLEDRGIPVARRLDLGGTLICLEALESGAIDVYPEYTGTGLVAVLGEEAPRDGLASFLQVKKDFAGRGLVWLDPFGFEDTYAVAVSRSLGVRTLSELAARAPRLTLAASEEFLGRPDGLALLGERYGMSFRSVKVMNHELAYLAVGRGAVDALDVYTTDPELASGDLVCLEDDRHAFPPYHAAPLARSAVLDQPGVRAALESLEGALDATTIRELNARVRGGERARDVARAFLARRNATPIRAKRGSRAAETAREIARWTGQHLVLSASALLVAALLGVPLGILAFRRPRLGGGLLATLGVIETIPSLALLGLLLPLLGIGAFPAIVALLLYALLPIVRGTTTGLATVDGFIVESATAIGLTSSQRLRLVELPLALGSIAAGIRTSAVIVVGTATLAAFIGAGGLGEPIFGGVKLARPSLVLEGAIPAALLALATDAALGLLERRLRRR
jgi:osmoprotectant transport system permease protein